MESALKYIKDKINNPKFGSFLTQIVYQYCTNSDCKPTSLDKLKICGYCKIVRTTHGLPPDEYGTTFTPKSCQHNIIVVFNPETRSYTHLALPPITNGIDACSHIFRYGDYCFWNHKKGFLEDTTIISNSVGEELLVESYMFDESDSIPGTYLFPEQFIDFSKYCLQYLGEDNIPNWKQMVSQYNKENE